MSEIVRKNEITFQSTFKPIAGQSGTPSAAEVVVVYLDTSGETKTDQLQMELGADGVTWTASWDSSLSQGGEVHWMCHCWGGLKAAEEGRFSLRANPANKV